MNPLFQTRGSGRHPIHVHFWSDGSVKKISAENNVDASVKNLFDQTWEKPTSPASNSDGQEMKNFQKYLSEQKKQAESQEGKKSQLFKEKSNEKNYFSQAQGEIFGHRYVTDILGYQEEFHGDNKVASMSQGLDSVYYDSKLKQLVVVEFKGQTSTHKGEQKDPNWTIDRCQKIQKGEGKYKQATEAEFKIANKIIEAYNRGEKIRYEVVRTKVSERTGKFKSQIEKETIIKKPPTEKVESKTVVDKLYSKSNESSKNRKKESKSESKKG